MKIQLSEIIMGKVNQTLPIKNKTLKYLTPCLRKYGDEFARHYNLVFKVAIGLGDMMIIDEEKRYEQHLFILIDTRIKPKNFVTFLDWIREEYYYQDDYVYDDIKKSPLHMVIVKIPEEYTQSFEKFTSGKYSEMYAIEDIDTLFSKHPEAKLVLTKDQSYKVRFVRRLNRLYSTTLKPEDYSGELDLPPTKEEEYFE